MSIVGRKARAKRNRRGKGIRKAQEKLKGDPVISRIKEFVHLPEIRRDFEESNPSWYADSVSIVPEYLEINQMVHFWQIKDGKAISSAVSNELILFEMAADFNESVLLEEIGRLGIKDCFLSCNPMTELVLYYRGSEWNKEMESFFGNKGLIYRSRSKGSQH